MLSMASVLQKMHTHPHISQHQGYYWDVKDNKKGFYRYIGRKRQTKESVLPLMKGNGELASSDIEKAEVLNECFVSVFMCGQVSCVCQDNEPLGEGVGSSFCPTGTSLSLPDETERV